jgi:hypothetical protein
MSGASGGRPQRHNEAVPSRHSIGTDAGSVPGGAHDRLRTGWNQRNDQYLRGQTWVPELGGKAWSLGCLPERRYPSRNRGITVGVHTILHRIFSPSKNQKGFHGTVPKFGCVALYQAPMRGSNSHDSTQVKACTHRRQQIGHVAGCMQCRSLRCVSPSTCMPVRNRRRTRVLGMHAGVEERSSGAKRSDSESRDVWGLRQRRRHGARFIGRVRAARALGQSARTETR